MHTLEKSLDSLPVVPKLMILIEWAVIAFGVVEVVQSVNRCMSRLNSQYLFFKVRSNSEIIVGDTLEEVL
jgi:hypothetical protein